MVHYIHVYGRQHGVTRGTAYQNIHLLEQAIEHKFGRMFRARESAITRIAYDPIHSGSEGNSFMHV
jgi:hypothetical protein